MATLIKSDGTEQAVEPRNSKEFKLEELYAMIGCSMVEAVSLGDGRVMWLDEESKLKSPWPPLNVKATKLLIAAGGIPGDVVLGNVIIQNVEEIEEDYSTDPLYGKRMDSADCGEN